MRGIGQKKLRGGDLSPPLSLFRVKLHFAPRSPFIGFTLKRRESFPIKKKNSEKLKKIWSRNQKKILANYGN